MLALPNGIEIDDVGAITLRGFQGVTRRRPKRAGERERFVDELLPERPVNSVRASSDAGESVS